MEITTTQGATMSRTVIINGTAVAAPERAVAYKYADPIEDARWIDDETEAAAIRSEDPGLIVWVDRDADED